MLYFMLRHHASCFRFILLCSLLFFAAHLRSQPASDLPKVLDNVLQGVVTVAVYESNTTQKQLGFRGSPSDAAYTKTLDLTSAESSGSGFVTEYKGKYYIVTNAHVVEKASEKQGSIYVYTIGNKKYEVKVIGGDSFYDIALLSFTLPPGNEIIPLHFRESEIKVGEAAYAIGNPLGEYPYTVTNGIISAKNRVRGGLTGKFGFLQSTATTIWGNSGGPLIDAAGQVMGINSQIAFTTYGSQQIWQPQLNFALEAPIARRLIADIIDNKGLVKRAFLGVEFGEYQQAQRSMENKFFKPERTTTEVGKPFISNIINGSPADGVLNTYIGAIILRINGEATRNLQEVLGCLEKAKPETVVVLELVNKGTQVTLSVKAGMLTADRSAALADFFTQQWGGNVNTDIQQKQLELKVEKKDVYSSFTGSGPDNISTINGNKPLSREALFDNDWVIYATGILSDDGSSLWSVQDAADFGAALRLTALSGMIDLVMYRKGSPPQSVDDLYRKRFYFSKDSRYIKEILYY